MALPGLVILRRHLLLIDLTHAVILVLEVAVPAQEGLPLLGLVVAESLGVFKLVRELNLKLVQGGNVA